MTRAHAPFPFLALAAALAAGGAATAQEAARPSRPYDPIPDSYRSPSGHRPVAPAGEEGSPATRSNARSVELALSDESFWIGLRFPVHEDGHVALGYLENEDDERLAVLRYMRTGRPLDEALELGLGLGAYGAWLEAPGEDPAVQALTLCASARYSLGTRLPTSLGVQAAYAPDVTTFDDGDWFLDATARLEVEISSFASAFVGYRYVQMGLLPDEDEREHRLEDRLHVGIRLAF